MKKSIVYTAAALLVTAVSGFAQDDDSKGEEAVPEAPPLITASPEGAKVYVAGMKDGKTVKAKNGKVTVRFGLKGMGVAPAGVHVENTGHHHLLIDMDASEVDLKLPIPMIEGKCLHYGGGQTETVLELAPGEHTLQLILGNWSHIPHNPPVISEKIKITVE